MALTHIVNPIIYSSPTIPRRFAAISPLKTLNPQFSRHTPQHAHALSRRLFLPSVSSIWDAITGGGDSNPREAIAAIRNGMQLFRQGDVSGSVTEFDKAIVLDSRQKACKCYVFLSEKLENFRIKNDFRSYVFALMTDLWQRGLSLYYMDRFEEGAEQFRLDVAQNPNDTEESIWCFLCEARLHGVDVARKQFLEVGRDSRPVMREAYNLFKNGGDPEKLVNDFLSGQASEVFYASLYAGLYYEAEGKSEKAKFHITAACGSPYGQRSDDYMASLAKVHRLCRNWSSGLV
ncbi:uncharacterized protein LOC125606978 isoform X1 [Brassica napus]|uniref:uncharacterized protein LOC125606978 isoform X1 n=1 Tax=Brassica napus TaxID=3708 RepID=UPI002078F82E|nr:uncharacterized protein LOC125606978 isoform X1 [Brassica napus]